MTVALALEQDFWVRFEATRRRHERLWRESSEEWPVVGPRTCIWRRFSNARAARRLIRDLASRIENTPEEPEEVEIWKCELRERVQRFGEERLDWPAGYRRLVFGQEFYGVSRAFVRDARRLDSSLGMEEIGQAMRNVWIVNSLQLLFGLPVALTKPVFAYSLLYPYTDNLLDDRSLSRAEKEGFTRRLGCWLAGERARPRGDLERRVRELVREIERVYSRAEQPDVFDSLLAIHGGQIRSLSLQSLVESDPARVLSTQVEKGGASVLADGYLAFGRLRPAQEDFCFGYGVFLQMLDDLQDVAEDRAAGHATLFSAFPPPLDAQVAKLWSYMQTVVEHCLDLDSPALADRKDLILRNCTLLMVGAIAESPQLFSRPFRRALVGRWPLRLDSMRSLRRFARGRFETSHRRLERRRAIESLWDLVD